VTMGSATEYDCLEEWRGKPIVIQLLDGKTRRGTLDAFDDRCLVVTDASSQRPTLIYKHAIISVDQYVPVQPDRTRTRSVRFG
jgi:sRNA-binding regulator protein Hfq